MQAQLETLGPLERRIRVSVPRAEIEAEVENRLKRLARTAKVHGFRPGKVPMKIVVQHYGGQVRQEVISEAGSRSIGDALAAQQLRIAGMPKFEASADAPGGDALEFSATFEVYPEVALGDIRGVRIERPVVQVTEADVDKTIEILRKQRARFEPVDRPAALGDRVEVDYAGTIDGEAFEGGTAQGYTLTLGAGRTLEDFDAGVVGMRAGETRSFELTFPADYRGREVAGKTARFEVTAHRVLGAQLPELDADFAKSLGVEDGDLARMRAEVRANIEREVKKRVDARVKEQVMDALLAATPVTVPRALVEMEVERLTNQARQDLLVRGIKADDVPLSADLFADQAERRVRLGLVLAEAVRANDLRAQPEQVRALVEEYAQSYEEPDKVVAWYYENPGRLAEIEALVLEQNVVSWALNQAQVEDRETAFDDLMGVRK